MKSQTIHDIKICSTKSVNFRLVKFGKYCVVVDGYPIKEFNCKRDAQKYIKDILKGG